MTLPSTLPSKNKLWNYLCFFCFLYLLCLIGHQSILFGKNFLHVSFHFCFYQCPLDSGPYHLSAICLLHSILAPGCLRMCLLRIIFLKQEFDSDICLFKNFPLSYCLHSRVLNLTSKVLQNLASVLFPPPPTPSWCFLPPPGGCTSLKTNAVCLHHRIRGSLNPLSMLASLSLLVWLPCLEGLSHHVLPGRLLVLNLQLMSLFCGAFNGSLH